MCAVPKIIIFQNWLKDKLLEVLKLAEWCIMRKIYARHEIVTMVISFFVEA